MDADKPVLYLRSSAFICGFKLLNIPHVNENCYIHKIGFFVYIKRISPTSEVKPQRS